MLDFIVGTSLLTYIFTGIYFTVPATKNVRRFIKKHRITVAIYPIHTMLWYFADAVALKADEL